MRQEHLSPCYTTRREDLPIAKYKCVKFVKQAQLELFQKQMC